MKDVIGFEGRYKITEDGKVYSVLTGVFLKPSDDTHGYDLVNLTFAERKENGKCKQIVKKVHKLLAFAYLGELPKDKPITNHKDGNKKNNHISNIEYVSYSENLQHAYDNGLRKPVDGLKGENNPSSKLSDIERENMLQRLFNGESSQAIAKDYGYSRPHIPKMFKERFGFAISRKSHSVMRKEEHLLNFSNPA